MDIQRASFGATKTRHIITRNWFLCWYSAPERSSDMGTVKLWTDEEVAADPRVQAVFDDIRRTRKTDFVNNFWRALANQPAVLARTWTSIKEIMIEPGTLDPLTKELIYIAVSTVNSCSYCIHSHTAAARAKGMTDQQHAELVAIIGMAAETNALANALQISVDPEFQV